MEEKFWESLCRITGPERALKNELMRNHTTFRIGGPADYFVKPADGEELSAVIRACREAGVPYFILGNGSNLLVGDLGYRGAVIQIFKNYSDVTVEGETMRVQAGAILAKAARAALENSLTGLEFASGIPGTMGGAVRMNAGAYGGEIRDVLKSAVVLTPELRFLEVPAADLALGYRHSSVEENGWIVLEAVLSLKKGDSAAISERMEELRAKRIEKQPLDLPSAGSTFKRPEGYFAGKLIMDAGLRGFSVGGAQVSQKHCGFVVNQDHATAKDVRELMRTVTETVQSKFGVTLEPEVRMLGEFS